MKKFLTILTAVILSLVSLQHAYADNPTEQTVSLKKCKNTGTKVDDCGYGRRVPGMTILGVINPGGIQIATVDNSEIVGFEIYSDDECLIASFIDEHDFTSCLFSLTGTYMLRFITEDYELVGYIEM